MPENAGDDEPHDSSRGKVVDEVANGSPGSRRSRSEGVLASLSSTIDSNLRIFRAGTATMVVGSALTVAFLVYRRGMNGFGSAAQVPDSLFRRRKRVRVRIAKVVAARRAPDAKGKGFPGDVRGTGAPTSTLQGSAVGVAGDVERQRGSDVLLHAEHITILRRLLRRPPRSLFPRSHGDAATFVLRLCGVSAEEKGLALAKKELVKPLIGQYCDAELLFREERTVYSSGGDGGAGFGVAASQKTSWPVAVCHIHRRRESPWRDLLLPRPDPKAGFGEHLISEGLARLREELWWATLAVDGSSTSRRVASGATARSTTGVDPSNNGSGPLPALKRLLADRERFVAAEESAEKSRKGLWAESVETGETETMGGDESWGGRSARVLRALMGFFGRR